MQPVHRYYGICPGCHRPVREGESRTNISDDADEVIAVWHLQPCWIDAVREEMARARARPRRNGEKPG